MNSAVESIAPSLESLRSSLTAGQKSLLDQIWSHFRSSRDWPPSRAIYSAAQQGKPEIVELLSPLTGNVVSEERNVSGRSTFALTFLGTLLTSEGPNIQHLIARYFELQRQIFKTEPDKQHLASQEIAAALGLSKEDTEILGFFAHSAHLFTAQAARAADHSWSVGVMEEAADFPPSGSLSEQVASWATRQYRPDIPVFEKDKIQRSAGSSYLSLSEEIGLAAHQLDVVKDYEAGPLQRRYQVFVSSTYNDLVEERRHVIQALLETKCIPSGMELFPAASEEQWKLIKRVIDDCDYYVVIVAGRYGSIGCGGKSFTEMEFDYGVSVGKPILGFYYADIRKLPGEKLEEADENRRKLAAFTAKVKNRMCKSWNSAEGLGSAIKSAVLNEIETNPKPGWVRANSVPSRALVRGLEQRIAELEGRSKNENSTNSFPAGEDKIEIPATITWVEREKSGAPLPWSRPGPLAHIFKLSWDEVFLGLASRLRKPALRRGLWTRFTYSLTERIAPEIRKGTAREVHGIRAKVQTKQFTQIIQTLVARKLLKEAMPAKRGGRRWTVTSKGTQRLAELNAIKRHGLE